MAFSPSKAAGQTISKNHIPLDQIVHPPSSLIVYDTPLLQCASVPETAGQLTSDLLDASHRDHEKNIMNDPETKCILNAMLPPRKWKEKNGNWQQDVSSLPSSRAAVLALKTALDTRLQDFQARKAPICPIREELHSQLFDELIRGLTLNSPERGLLVLRIRDEIRMRIHVYQTLYASSLEYGRHRMVLAEDHVSQLKMKLQLLKEKKAVLTQRLQARRVSLQMWEEKVQGLRTKRVARFSYVKETMEAQHVQIREFQAAQGKLK